MNTSAVFMMVITEVIIASITGYFFWRVLTSPKREEPDSFSENEDDPGSKG